MSDSMERDKNERLTTREIEEEEMKRKLTGIGIYEPGITYNEMKTLLGFLNESEDTSNVASDNKNIQERTQHVGNECLSEITSDTNASPELITQERTEMSKSMYSYKLNRTSPTVHERKTTRHSSSPESSSRFEIPNSVYRRKSSDSDEIFDKQHESPNCTNNTNRFLSPRSGSALRECRNAIEMKTSAQSEHNQKLDRWRLNPLDVCINENDVPLQQPSRPSAQERVPFRYCKEAYMSEQRDEVMQALNLHLKEMADLWYTWHHPTNSKFQWGSPIQVGTANGSLDRKPLTDSKTEQMKAECIYRDNYERVNKRKASSFIASLHTESSTEDEDDQYNFACVKKGKLHFDEKLDGINHSNKHIQVSHDKTIKSITVHDKHSLDDDNSNINFDNEDVKSVYRKRRADEKNERLSPDLTTYPRRIVPPNPKTRLNRSKQKTSNVTSKPFQKIQYTDKNIEQAKNKKKDNTIMNEDIYQKSKENSDEEETLIITKKNIKIQPLPISKEIRSRLQKKQISKKMEKNKGTKVMSKEEEDKKKQNEEIRIEERRKDKKLCKIEDRDISWKQQFLSNEDEPSEMNLECDMQNGQCDNVSTSISHVSCPICNKLFPCDEIEDHAADCEQFDTNNEDNDSDMDQLECNICNNYKTNNGVEYEEHVQQCINGRNDKRHLHNSEDVNVETSSFCSYKSINAQKNSEIDNIDQLVSYSRAKILSGRKRKH